MLIHRRQLVTRSSYNYERVEQSMVVSGEELKPGDPSCSPAEAPMPLISMADLQCRVDKCWGCLVIDDQADGVVFTGYACCVPHLLLALH